MRKATGFAWASARQSVRRAEQSGKHPAVQHSPKRRAILALAAAAVPAVLNAPAFADSATWTGVATGTWSDIANWNAGAGPAADGAGSTANFNTVDVPAGGITVNLDTPRTIGSLIFGDTDPATTGTWTLANNGDGANVLTLNNGAAAPTITVNSGAATTLSAVVSGTQGFTKLGAGNLTLTAANTYTGGTNIASGTLVLGSNVSFGNGGIGAGPITFTGGTLGHAYAGGNTLNYEAATPIVVATGDTGTILTPNRFRLNAPVSGGGTLNMAINTTVGRADFQSNWATFTGNLNLTGSGNIRLGVQALGSGQPTFSAAGWASTTLSVDGVSIGVQTNSGGNTMLVGALSSTGAAGVLGGTINNAGSPNWQVGAKNLDTTFGGIFSGNAVLTKVGTGTLTLAGNSNNTTVTTISAGVLQYGAGGTAGAPGTGNIVNNATLRFNRSDTLTLPNTISGTGGVVQAGPGTTVLTSATNSYAGGNTITAGTLQGTNTSVRGNVVNNGTLALDAAIAAGSFAGAISGSGAVNKVGANALTLTGANTYTGGTTASTGTLRVAGGPLTTSGVTVAGGATFGVNANTSVAALTLNSGASLALHNGGTPLSIQAANFSAAGTATLNPGNALANNTTYTLVDYDGAIGGDGFGALTLAALPPRVSANLVNNTDNTSVDLRVTAIDFPKWTGAVNANWDVDATQNWRLVNAGTATTYLEPTPPGDAVLFDDTAPAANRNVNLTTALQPVSVTVNTDANYTFSGGGAVAGPAYLLKTGTGTLTLANTGGNTYSGGTTLAGGTLRLGVNNALPTGGSVRVSVSAGTLDLGGNTQDLSGVLALSGGTIANGTINKSVSDYDLASGTVSAALAGPVGFLKTTPGTVVLTNTNNSYTGGTTVSAGTLQLGDGAANGAVPNNGNIVNNAAVVFDNGTDQVYTGQVSGTGTFTKNGPGTLTLTAGGTAGGSNQGPAILNGGTTVLEGVTAANGNFPRLGRGANITINSGATLSLTGTEALGLNSGSAPAGVIVMTGGTVRAEAGTAHQIYGTTLAGGTITGGGSINMRGTVVATADSTIDVATLGQVNTQSWNVSSGVKLTVNSPLNTAANVNKAGTGVLLVNNATQVGALNVQAGTLAAAPAGTAAPGTLLVRGLTIAAAGTFDLADNALVVDYVGTAGPSPIDTIRGYLQTALGADQTWSGPGLTSSAARDRALHVTSGPGTALAYEEASAYIARTGSSQFGSVTVDTDAVLVKYTLTGDATFDGDISDADVNALVASYGNGLTTNTWSNADFSYDGVVNDRDVDLLAAAIGAGGPAVTVTPAGLARLASLSGAPVPEPAAFGIASVVLTFALSHRRRRSVR